ncbi:MAG: N-acetylmuramoyl-L-alanine amidase [PS1 clade bacterium]|uniref:N-acetylmuramoyl-L-alanine amidase n=1 Tax=PS1 clade bacterium TaxID=2175152 RepID=A0A368E1J3_9PROT|nr:MAG: N-acetylmuramoyl-L-alanine amidase [PS1 clade bacterium]
MIECLSPNFNPRPGEGEVNMLIMHTTCMADTQSALDRLCDPASKVSAHYVIDEVGQVYHLVDERERAWHAGVAFWDGVTDVNGCSIGIEIAHPGPDENGEGPEFPSHQWQALINLSQDIIGRHPIPAHRVLAHSDVAPSRKTDPGPLFDWQGLAKKGVGLWSDYGEKDLASLSSTDLFELAPLQITGNEPEKSQKVEQLQHALRAYGYQITPDGVYGPATQTVMRAFQLHFRSERIDGIADAVCCARLLDLIGRKQ